ncbi:MAG: transposase [Actinobacteria bacterium]|nr:transposase [Actinomycetota bacterium]
MEGRHFTTRKRLRLREFDYSQPYAYFLTICCKDKRAIFVGEELNKAVCYTISEEIDRLNFDLFTYCLMPNHLHLLLSPGLSNTPVSRYVQGFKSKSTRMAWMHGISGIVWQRGCYDHIVRGSESLLEIATYIVNNPVRKGLAGSIDDYPYSGINDNLIY